MGNNKDDKVHAPKDRDYTLEELKKATIKDSDDFQDEFEMVAEEVELKKGVDEKELWITRIKVLILSGIFAMIGNYINTMKAGKPVSPIDIIPAMLAMLAIIVVSCFLDDFLRKNTKVSLPTIVYISLIAMILSIPGVPFSEAFVAGTNKIGLLPLCTPILAYAGIALGKDLDDFKKQGAGIVVVACMAFVGTYVSSAIVSEVLLRLFGKV